jgi:hypothetical protein
VLYVDTEHRTLRRSEVALFSLHGLDVTSVFHRLVIDIWNADLLAIHYFTNKFNTCYWVHLCDMVWMTGLRSLHCCTLISSLNRDYHEINY